MDSPLKRRVFDYPNHTYYIILLLLIIMTFFPLLDTGFVSVDDMRNNISFMANRSWVISRAHQVACDQGRFNYLISIFAIAVPNLIDSFVYYKVVTFAHVLSNMLLFAWVLQRFFKSKALTIFALGFFCLSLQYLWEHFLLLHDPFHGQLTITFILLSLGYFIKNIETRKCRYLIYSAILYFFGAVCYEAAISYIFIFLLLSLFYAEGKQRCAMSKDAVRLFLPYLLTVMAYIALYFSFRILYSSKYAGTSFDLSSPTKNLRVIYHFGISSFPTYVFNIKYYIFHLFSDTYAGVGTLSHYFASVRVEWIVKALLGMLLTHAMLSVREKIFSGRSFIATFLIAIALVFVPSLLHSMASQYQEWVIVSGCIAYVTTYYSFFGSVLLFSSIIFYLNQIITWRYRL